MIYIIKQEGLYQNKVTVSLASTIIVKWPIAAGYYSSPKTNRRQWLCKILGGEGGVKKVKQMKLCANGSYNFQHVGSCCVPLHVAKRLTSVKLCATIPKNMQQHAITESSAV